MKRILIANRGEIAVRIMRTCRLLGIETVAVYSEADAQSYHRRLATYSFPLRGHTSQESYLDIEQILQAMRDSGADAVHPGYGFLSESHQFAQAIKDAGYTFIGPGVEAIRQMGDKIEARRLMKDAGIPTVPGSDEPLSDWHVLEELAEDVGYPLILKAAAGGGGRGMRVVHDSSMLKESFEACQREAQSYFGNPAVFCERYINAGRHIEFQVLADNHGNVVHLFERDCSIQRRHQKLIEEAPSLYLNEEQRAALGKIAVDAARAVNYSGAGTVEFICESPDKCYFMEMNTRIQVEHPVTEMITGVDLIEQQIRVARNEPLSMQQSDLQINGWACEARINAEDPTRDFMPDPGVIENIRLPAGPAMRVDTHIFPGYKIPAFYDSMIAKVISWGPDRTQALQRLKTGLSEWICEGITTTAKFHEALIQNADFAKGDITTRFLEQETDTLLEQMQTCEPAEEAAILAAVLKQLESPAQANKAPTRELWGQRARYEGHHQT